MLQPRIPLSLALAPQVQGHCPYFWRGAFPSWLQTSGIASALWDSGEVPSLTLTPPLVSESYCSAMSNMYTLTFPTKGKYCIFEPDFFFFFCHFYNLGAHL